MANGVPTAPSRSHPPYRAGWINHLVASIERLPGPFWGYYLGLGVLLTASYTLIKWRDGAYAEGQLFIPHLLFAGAAPYTLYISHLMIRTGYTALARMRPVLTEEGEHYALLAYRLTQTPALPSAVASLAGLGLGYLLWRVYLPPYNEALKLSSNTIAGFEALLLFATMSVIAAGVYQLISQLRAINYITHATQINLFGPQPLYSLTYLALRGATSVALYTLMLALGAPQVSSAPIILLIIFGMQALAAATFFLPLLGVHRKLLEEKQLLQEHVGQRMQNALRELHSKADAGDGSAIESQLKILNGLQAEMGIIEKTSTWPWHPETMRLVATAIILPMIVYVAQKFFGKLFPGG